MGFECERFYNYSKIVNVIFMLCLHRQRERENINDNNVNKNIV